MRRCICNARDNGRAATGLNSPRNRRPCSPIETVARDPLNHIGVQVDDLDATEARVIAAGLLPFSHADYEPGRRFYFLDPDGIEYEVVSYTKAS
jgi:catechol 2,3-dioxygenase-like lactoylglutathione lyase family enzyme